MSLAKLKPDRPSQLYDQIEQLLTQLMGDELAVKGYEEYGRAAIDSPTLLIEFEDGRPGVRGGDGRYCHGYHISVHCLIPNSVKRSALVALNVAADVERFVDENRWGIDSRQIDAPEHLRTEPSLFQQGAEGFEGRAVSWKQNLYLGNSLLEPDEFRGGIRLAVNPSNQDDAGSYAPLEVSDAPSD
ncbi:hypothetical protein ABCL21_004468 [Vibrio parahaemolyticus]